MRYTDITALAGFLYFKVGFTDSMEAPWPGGGGRRESMRWGFEREDRALWMLRLETGGESRCGGEVVWEYWRGQEEKEGLERNWKGMSN